ncbi:hypothetical protein [Streptomyces sp. NPDC126933]|uniref:hypothetical protein n=1 Tax=unclassified Streptomyces TaxID=2593676 RepID=UPI0036600880
MRTAAAHGRNTLSRPGRAAVAAAVIRWPTALLRQDDERVKGSQERPSAVLDGTRRKLDRAASTGNLVRIDRSIRGADSIEGFVVGASGAWTLLAPCTDVLVDGYTAVRTSDITRVKRRGDENSLTVRALRRRGHWPVAKPMGGVLPRDLHELLVAGSRHYGLLGVHTEHRRTDACWIGALVGLRRKSLGLHLIDPDARWHDEPSKFAVKHVTRVDFGGRYGQALREFAAPRPWFADGPA